MWVVKIGGSLQESNYLAKWLDCLLEYGKGKVVLVPGGGLFADSVRHEQLRDGFDDVQAHNLALLAMEKYANLLISITPQIEPVDNLKSIRTCLDNKEIPIWMPHKMVVGEPEIPDSWDVTSDGLAAWLAIQLQFNSLILVKSVSLPAKC